MMMYQLVISRLGDDIVIRRNSDGACIPVDELNTDYQEYLKWVAEGNTAEEWKPEEV
jgi:hypothetical protein